MPITNCTARSNASAGSQMVAKLEAMGCIVDYDHIQGNNCTTVFYPLTAARQYPRVPLYFDVDSRIEGKKLTCMELVDGSQIASYSGVDMPSNFTAGWITLRDNCNNILVEFPISKINRALNGGKNVFFGNLPVDWGKSSIHLTSVSGLSSAGFLFRIWTK